MDSVVILVLAAGNSSRMRGADKLLEVVDGVALLRRQAGVALQVGSDVIVALPPEATARREALAGLDVTRVEVPDASEGMAASIRRGVAAASPGARGVMILPADMPEITARDIASVLSTFVSDGENGIVRGATADGRGGHPVVLPRRLFPALCRLTGDTGARDVVAGEAVKLVALPGEHALTDLDTPEAWQAWRKSRERL